MELRDWDALPVGLAFLVHVFGGACLALVTGFAEGDPLKKGPEKHHDILGLSAQELGLGFLEIGAVEYLFGLQLLLAWHLVLVSAVEDSLPDELYGERG